MNALGKISKFLAVLCAAIVVVACNNDTDTVLTQQQTSIEKYLTTSHQPRLMEESTIGSSTLPEPPFYTRWDMDIYRYISTYYEKGREEKAEIVKGTTFDIIYTAYIFTGSDPKVADMYATNDETSLKQLQDLGLNTSFEWTTEPMRLTLGKSAMIEGLRVALEGCREGDSVEVYMTFAAAYGKNYIGKVPTKSSVVWKVNIVDIVD